VVVNPLRQPYISPPIYNNKRQAFASNMIEIHNLTKKFGEFTAVNNLSFSVAPGEILGFLGPNGAGKSTTMKMITGFLTPDAGSVQVFGADIGEKPIAVKSQIGYLPEGAPSYGDMTTLQFLRFIAEVRGFDRDRAKARIEDVIKRLELEKVLQQPIETLSKGFKRRVGLAQAIIHDPRVLILDEPTDGLDPNQKYQVRELIHNLSRDKIVIISTHILEEVSAVCSRAIIINNGEIVADGTPAELQTQSRYYRAVTLQLVDDATFDQQGVTSVLRELPGVETIEQDLDHARTFTVFPQAGQEIYTAVSKAIQDNDWQVDELHVDLGRLDDVFRSVTGGQL